LVEPDELSAPAAPLISPPTGSKGRAALSWAVVLVPLIGVLALCLHWEPILRDSWGNYLWFRSNGRIDGEALWGNLWGAYIAGNPRLGQFATFLLFSSELVHIVATTAMGLASFTCLTALALGRWPSWRRAEDAWLFGAIVAMVLVGVPQVGPMFFYRPFVGNYVYGFFFHLVLYLPYRFFARSPGARPWWWTPALLLWGLAAGLTNEHTGPASLVVLVVAVAWFRCRGDRWAAWMFAGVLGLLAGYLLLYFAPGQAFRYNGLAAQQTLLQRIFSRSAHDSFRIVYTLLISLAGLAPWALVSLVTARVRRHRPAPVDLRISAAALITGALMVLTLFGSPKWGPRLYFASTSMFILAVSIWVRVALSTPWARRLLVALSLGASLYAYVVLLRTYATANREFEARMAMLDRSSGRSGGSSLRSVSRAVGVAVEVPRYSQSQSRWFLGDDFRAERLRQWVANELGIPSLTLGPPRGGVAAARPLRNDED
jgi:Family of unknown function (DUF6056)